MMQLCVAILFLAPFDVQTAVYIFCFQSLTQLAGFACELIRGTEISDVPGRKFSLSRPTFYAAAAYWILPWSLLLFLFWVSGYTEPATQTIPGPDGLPRNPAAGDKTATPPVQGKLRQPVPQQSPVLIQVPSAVTFFLGWLFSSFALFPVVLWWKLNSSGQVPARFDAKNTAEDRLLVWNYRYEILFGVLSFVSKIPLQVRWPSPFAQVGVALADAGPRRSLR